MLSEYGRNSLFYSVPKAVISPGAPLENIHRMSQLARVEQMSPLAWSHEGPLLFRMAAVVEGPSVNCPVRSAGVGE